MLTISSLTVVIATMSIGLAQSGTNESGIINSDTTWTMANNPYNFAGSVTVNQGATLTIEAGVTVNMFNFDLQVDGTLKVQGSDNDKVVFFSANPHMYPYYAHYPNWDIFLKEDSSGCIIENAILNSTTIICKSSTKINNDTFNDGAEIEADSETTVSNCTIIGIVSARGSSVISNNTIVGFPLSWSELVDVPDGSPLISSNTITSGPFGYVAWGIFLSGSGNTAVISNNVISNSYEAGIVVTGTPLIEGNLIENNSAITSNQWGVGIESESQNLTIKNNTIVGNTIGINIHNPSVGDINSAINATIIYNNIFNNSRCNFLLGRNLSYWSNLTAGNINATYNWWGTIDIKTINQTIYDFKNESDLGIVTFVPFLNAQNPHATPISYISTATPSPTQTIPEFPTLIILPLFAVATLLSLVLTRKISKILKEIKC